jgi:hypothetical protein
MKQIFAVCAAVAAIGFMASSARAEISTEAARDSVAPFYKALNAEFAKESAELVKPSTAPQWISRPGPRITCARNSKSPVFRN